MVILRGSLGKLNVLLDCRENLSIIDVGPKKKQIHLTAIDEVIHKFQSLNLNGSSNGQQKPDQNALVLYKGNGAVVPYEIKKRKPRPKVDLDPETNRIWNLLMGKEGSENLEGTDKEKEKWWEDERKVFRGRVDSFIARMHLVQGELRYTFSPKCFILTNFTILHIFEYKHGHPLFIQTIKQKILFPKMNLITTCCYLPIMYQMIKMMLEPNKNKIKLTEKKIYFENKRTFKLKALVSKLK